MHARARTKTRGNPDRGTRVPGTKSCSGALVVRLQRLRRSRPSRNASAHRDGSLQRQDGVRHFLLSCAVLASSSNMTRARSGAVSLGGGSRPGVGLTTASLGLDCHEFSSAPSYTNAWSTRFLPGQMFPVRVQTITSRLVSFPRPGGR